jgi:hypothetical protein
LQTRTSQPNTCQLPCLPNKGHLCGTLPDHTAVKCNAVCLDEIKKHKRLEPGPTQNDCNAARQTDCHLGEALLMHHPVSALCAEGSTVSNGCIYRCRQVADMHPHQDAAIVNSPNMLITLARACPPALNGADQATGSPKERDWERDWERERKSVDTECASSQSM